MSELTTRFVDDTYFEYYNTGKHELAQIYLKSEADKVIAEQTKEIAELKAKITKSKELADGIRRDIEKVKADSDETLALLEERNRQIGNLDAIAKRNQRAAQTLRKKMNHHKYKRCLAMAKICEDKLGTVVKPGWWNKWHKRFLGLAEKFKEGV